MIKEVTMYTVVCDRCGKEYYNEDSCSCAWCDAEDARYDAVGSGRGEWQNINGRDLCPDCYHMDENDEYIENEKGDTK